MPKKPDQSAAPSNITEEADTETKRNGGILKARPQTCSVCGSEAGAPIEDETLCWVCRRLKISAWRESDQQITLQE